MKPLLILFFTLFIIFTSFLLRKGLSKQANASVNSQQNLSQLIDSTFLEFSSDIISGRILSRLSAVPPISQW